MMRALLLLSALSISTAATAEPLTIRMGESWIFSVKDGQPASARKVGASAKPAKGQIMASVRAFLGTSMVVTNNSPIAYTFRAELLSGGKTTAARSCTLPANARPTFEQWPEKAEAVRIGGFKPATADGRC